MNNSEIHIFDRNAKIVVIGGGTGISTLLLGLKKYFDNITAIVTVSDNGGGSGQIRRELGMLPPGDIRNCILALADAEGTMSDVMNYRFADGVLCGQSFGNLFLAALNGICGSFEKAVERMSEVLAVKGRVIPVTAENIQIKAKFSDGSIIIGETEMCEYKKKCGKRIENIELLPNEPAPVAAAVNAIENADFIILGPGSLYTSIIPNLLVKDIAKTIENSDALKIYIMNIMTQPGETDGYSASQHIEAIFNHSSGRKIINICIANSAKAEDKIAAKYSQEGSNQIFVQNGELDKFGISVFYYDLLYENDSLARHDSDKLAKAIATVLIKYRLAMAAAKG